MIAPVNIGTDHIRGSIDAPISIVEYGDYECPYTEMAYPLVKEIMKQFSDDMVLREAEDNKQFVDTAKSMQPLGRFADPEEIANAVVWL